MMEDPTERVLRLLGDRDPIAVLRATPAALGEIVAGRGDGVLRTRPAPDKWMPVEILGHLVDHEIITASRIRLLRFDDTPPIVAYDQEAWVRGQAYAEADAGVLVERFGALRAHNLAQYEATGPDELERTGVHGRVGVVTLGWVLRVHAGHDLAHLDQIRRYLDAGR